MRIIGTIIIAMTLSSVVCGQSSDFKQNSTIAAELLELEILSEIGKASLEEEIAWDTENEFVILDFLNRAFYSEQMYRMELASEIEDGIEAEDVHVKFWLTTTYIGAKEDYKGLVHPNRSVYGRTRTRTADELFELGLYSPRTYKFVKTQLEDSVIRHESELMQVICSQEKWLYEYEEMKNREQEFSKKLMELGLLDSLVLIDLDSQYKEYELLGRHKILRESRAARFFDQRVLPEDLTERYIMVFEIIQEVLPNFEYSELSVVPQLDDTDPDLFEESLILSFKSANSIYTHKFYNRFIKKRKVREEKDGGVRISSEFHKGVNKYLKDIGSNLRLHFVNVRTERKAYGDEECGLIVLNEKQAEYLSDYTYFVSNESYERTLTSSAIDSLVKSFQSIGLVSEPSLGDDWAQKIMESENNHPRDVLMSIPNVVVQFDWETGNLENPYEELTNLFAKASRGAFTPQQIVDGYALAGQNRNDEVEYGFTYKGNAYSRMLRYENDWLDPSFLDFIHAAMSENEVDGEFHFCVDNGQETGFIFLTASQYDWVAVNCPDLIIDY